MILGSGGIGIVLESEDGARRRYSMSSVSPNLHSGPFCCRLLGTLISNSAYHGASMDKMHIASEMERFVSSMEREQLIPRRELAMHGVYFSHETSTHASATSSCSYNEVSKNMHVLCLNYLHVTLQYLNNLYFHFRNSQVFYSHNNA